jgi:hypothetical protein
LKGAEKIMGQFITRVELHRAHSEKYEQLHRAMESCNFGRTIQAASGAWHLPEAEYQSRGNLTASDVRGIAAQAIKSIGATGMVFVSEISNWAAEGLRPVG